MDSVVGVWASGETVKRDSWSFIWSLADFDLRALRWATP